MRGADLAFIAIPIVGGALRGQGGGRAVMGGHVGFQLVGVGAGGGLPAGFFGRMVEVVRQIFGIGMAHFPGGGEAGVGLGEGGSACLRGWGGGGKEDSGGVGGWVDWEGVMGWDLPL